MKVAALLERRRQNWHELERLCSAMENRRKRTMGGEVVNRFASLYRAACADLALADAYQLPPNSVQYLHQLVGRAHNQLYRSRSFRFSTWLEELFVSVPRRLYHDNYLRAAFFVFWSFFLVSMFLAWRSPEFGVAVVGTETLEGMERMHEDSTSSRDPIGSSVMIGFYLFHNGSIGLRCFAMGLLAGVGGLFELLSNAIQIGASFGYMTTADDKARKSFFEFVTAHAPFELTAIVMSTAAGMRMGFSLVATGGLTRKASLTKAAREAVPTMAAFVVLFLMAAFIEWLISPLDIGWSIKIAIATISSIMLLVYFVVLPNTQVDARAT
jgi:uncharacterized membrane protein SpoIIM required for sporulation